MNASVPQLPFVKQGIVDKLGSWSPKPQWGKDKEENANILVDICKGIFPEVTVLYKALQDPHSRFEQVFIEKISETRYSVGINLRDLFNGMPHMMSTDDNGNSYYRLGYFAKNGAIHDSTVLSNYFFSGHYPHLFVATPKTTNIRISDIMQLLSSFGSPNTIVKSIRGKTKELEYIGIGPLDC